MNSGETSASQSGTDSHVGYYRANQAYADRLSGNSEASYAKYYTWLAGDSPQDARILDVGCGSGQAVHALAKQESEAYGVEVAKASLKLATQNGPGDFRIFDGLHLPFKDDFFDAVGSFTVLEHVEDPELALREMVRVLRPGGTIVVACPNFLRVLGLSAHHPHTRGLTNKLRNLAAVLSKSFQLAVSPRRMHFAHMPLVQRDGPFQPDDDAITVTNALDILAIWRQAGVRKVYHSSLLYPSRPLLEAISRLPLVRTLTGGVFLVGRKRA